jgi:hypothetical protein
MMVQVVLVVLELIVAVGHVDRYLDEIPFLPRSFDVVFLPLSFILSFIFP